jgi:hypothetical protein
MQQRRPGGYDDQNNVMPEPSCSVGRTVNPYRVYIGAPADEVPQPVVVGSTGQLLTDGPRLHVR